MYFKIKLYSFICQVCVVQSLGNVINNLTKMNILETCVEHIVSSKTLHGADVAIIIEKFENDLIRVLHESNNVKVFIKDHNVPVNISPDAYVIHCDDKNKFEHVVYNLNRDWYRQPNALHIIILANINKVDLPTIFKVLWNYHIIHVLVTVQDTEEDGSIYTYLPYAAGHCGRDYNHTIRVGQCKRNEDWDVVEKLQDYDKPDLTNCTFNILTHHYPPLVLSNLKPATDIFAVGIEMFLVDLLLNVEHISPNYTFVPETARFGSISDNFTVTGVMKKLFENEADMLFGGFSLNYKRAFHFDYIYIHLAFEDIFIPVTPNSGLRDRWKIVYIIFDYKVWLLLMFTMFICSLILSGSNSSSIFQYQSTSELLKLFGNATQNVALNLRGKLYMNVIIIYWLWFIFLTCCYYQTRLTSYSTFRAYNPQINEYMSLQNYNLTPCFSTDIAMFLKNCDIPIINEQSLDTRSCLTADQALDTVAKTSNKYTVTIYYKYMWWASKHMRENSHIHVMQENIYKTHYALFLKRGFPLLSKFEATMSRIVECGFVQAIKGLYRFSDDPRYASSVAGAFEVRLLTFYDLILAFSILVAGYVFALLVFIIEIIYNTDITFVL